MEPIANDKPGVLFSFSDGKKYEIKNDDDIRRVINVIRSIINKDTRRKMFNSLAAKARIPDELIEANAALFNWGSFAQYHSEYSDDLFYRNVDHFHKYESIARCRQLTLDFIQLNKEDLSPEDALLFQRLRREEYYYYISRFSAHPYLTKKNVGGVLGYKFLDPETFDSFSIKYFLVEVGENGYKSVINAVKNSKEKMSIRDLINSSATFSDRVYFLNCFLVSVDMVSLYDFFVDNFGFKKLKKRGT